MNDKIQGIEKTKTTREGVVSIKVNYGVIKLLFKILFI